MTGHRRTARRGSARHCHLTIRMHSLDTGREKSNGKRNLLSHNGRRPDPAWRWHPHMGANPSSPNAAPLSATVSPFSLPARSAEYTDFGSRYLARCCAMATVSNQMSRAMTAHRTFIACPSGGRVEG